MHYRYAKLIITSQSRCPPLQYRTNGRVNGCNLVLFVNLSVNQLCGTTCLIKIGNFALVVYLRIIDFLFSAAPVMRGSILIAAGFKIYRKVDSYASYFSNASLSFH